MIIETTENIRYKLAPGTQVRREDFGLLFYTQTGPRLYFLPSGDLLDCDFFQGLSTLYQWLIDHTSHAAVKEKTRSLNKALDQLKDKGVLIGF
jgi:putative mycofactocin binding protein MftB